MTALSVTAERPGGKVPDLFDKYVEVMAEPCWVWRGGVTRGYGCFHVDRISVAAHRIAYEAAFGPIQDGLEIDHLCRNRACVNPAHLEAVTPSENQLRAKRLPVCRRGHEMTPENSYSYTKRDGRGYVTCRACRVLTQQRWRKRTR